MPLPLLNLPDVEALLVHPIPIRMLQLMGMHLGAEPGGDAGPSHNAKEDYSATGPGFFFDSLLNT